MDLWRSAPTPTVFRRWPQIFFLRQAPKGRKLEGYQVEKKSEAAQTKPKKLIRRTCPRDHGSDGSGLKWHAPPCSESAAQKKSFEPLPPLPWSLGPQRRGLHLLSCTLRARRSVPLWTATITSMATRACAYDELPSFNLRCFAFLLCLLAF